MSNTQKPEPRAKGNGDTLDFHSMFFTIQGEGPFAGHRAIFIRLAGCNLQCPGCDTEYTDKRQTVEVAWIVRGVRNLLNQHFVAGKVPLIVITGGEPLRQQIGLLCATLYEAGFNIQIESNGVMAPDDRLAALLQRARSGLTLVVSPKTKAINATTAALAHAFKYVIDHRSVDPNDGLPIMALEHPAAGGVARPPDQLVPVYVNPYDAKDEQQNQLNLQAAAASAMRFGHICGVQMHKLIGLE